MAFKNWSSSTKQKLILMKSLLLNKLECKIELQQNGLA